MIGLTLTCVTDMLPIIHIGLESPTHAIVDKSLGCLPTILSSLDFSTIKNELFPTVAAVFSKTSSLGIKVRGLEAFVVLCGGSNTHEPDPGDGLDGTMANPKKTRSNNSAVLDKYTVQEKIVPLLKSMKTKEPAVMMAALDVFKQVGKIADTEFLAIEVLPLLWSFSLGPLLNLQQFQGFIELIKKLSARIEQEQIKKLREVSSNSGSIRDTSKTSDLMSISSTNGLFGTNGGEDIGENDFERLVLGKRGVSGAGDDMLGDALQPQSNQFHSLAPEPPIFSWSSAPLKPTQNRQASISAYPTPQPQPVTQTTPLNSFVTSNSTPSSGIQNNYKTPNMTNHLNSFVPMQPSKPSSPWPSLTAQQSFQQPQLTFLIPPPPQMQPTTSFSGFAISPPPTTQAQRPGMQTQGGGYVVGETYTQSQPQQQQKDGLDAYESLI